MKIKNITLGIKNAEQGLKEFASIAKSIQSGHIPKAEREQTYFVSVNAFHSVLTLRRLELIHVIRVHKPESIYQLAHLLKRNLKNVQNDVTLLARIGLITLSKKKEVRNKLTPRVDYDKLQVEIPVA